MSLKLPEGWLLYPYPPGNVAYLDRPGGGSVTIDFDERIFSGGVGRPHPLTSKATVTYSGRGWRDKLVSDACEWLEGVMK